MTTLPAGLDSRVLVFAQFLRDPADDVCGCCGGTGHLPVTYPMSGGRHDVRCTHCGPPTFMKPAKATYPNWDGLDGDPGWGGLDEEGPALEAETKHRAASGATDSTPAGPSSTRPWSSGWWA